MNKGFSILSGRSFVVQFLLVLCTLVGLASCGGGGGGSGGGTASSGTTAPVNEATLSGVAATGAPLPGRVTVVGAGGNTAETTIDSDGRFQLSVAGMTPPFLLRGIPDNSDDPTLYSFSSTINSNVNVTPLTHLAVFVAADRVDLDAVYNSWAVSNSLITGAALANAQSRVRTNFNTQLEQAGLDVELYDFMITEFTADGTGIDGVLDALHVVVDFNSGTVTVTDLDGDPIEFALDDPIFAGHPLGPQVSVIPGNIDIHHAALADRVVSFIFDVIAISDEFTTFDSFSTRTGPSGADVDNTVACETGGEVRTALTRARADNSFNGSSLRIYKDCRPVEWPLGLRTFASSVFDGIKGEFTNQFRYIDNATVFGRYTIRAFEITDGSRTLFIDGEITYDHNNGVSKFDLSPGTESGGIRIRYANGSFNSAGLDTYVEELLITQLSFVVEDHTFTKLSMEIEGGNNNQPRSDGATPGTGTGGYQLRVELQEPLEGLFRRTSGRLLITENPQLVPTTPNAASTRLTVEYFVAESGTFSMRMGADFNGDGVIPPNDILEIVVETSQTNRW